MHEQSIIGDSQKFEEEIYAGCRRRRVVQDEFSCLGRGRRRGDPVRPGYERSYRVPGDRPYLVGAAQQAAYDPADSGLVRRRHPGRRQRPQRDALPKRGPNGAPETHLSQLALGSAAHRIPGEPVLAS